MIDLFLQRFLDATKSNLFFAKGVIMVEGDAENLLIPVIAEIIGYPLEKYGVSISSVKDQFVLQLEAHGLNDEKESVYDRRGILSFDFSCMFSLKREMLLRENSLRRSTLPLIRANI